MIKFLTLGSQRRYWCYRETFGLFSQSLAEISENLGRQGKFCQACLVYWRECRYCPTRHEHFWAYDQEYLWVLGLVRIICLTFGSPVWNVGCWFWKICYTLPWSDNFLKCLGLKSGVQSRRFGCSVWRRLGVSASVLGASAVSLNLSMFFAQLLVIFNQISDFALTVSNREVNH